MSCRSLYFRATQHPLAGFARSSFSRDWLSTESAGDSPHGAFPCRSPVTTATQEQHDPTTPRSLLHKDTSPSPTRYRLIRILPGHTSLRIWQRLPRITANSAMPRVRYLVQPSTKRAKAMSSKKQRSGAHQAGGTVAKTWRRSPPSVPSQLNIQLASLLFNSLWTFQCCNVET